MNTNHANARAQQRSIPPLVLEWLNEYGEEQFDGRGAIIQYFSRQSIRAMERRFGSAPLRKLSQYHGVYKVETCDTGETITVGHRTKRVNRR